MKVLLAPDSFKGTLSSREVAETIKNCIVTESPEAEALAIPVSDGGEGLVDCVYTTNLIHQDPELLKRDYYVSVDMCDYLAALIDEMNHDVSIDSLLSPTFKIQDYLAELRLGAES